ncbi:MAG: glycosyltransferase family 4 protein [Gammaproteobacteria bacterium]|nr:glycosyltransferase family 4 protein [Gammaproteobacteria bacterium]
MTALSLSVVVSNGFGQFHLRIAAAEAQARSALAGFITGGYPNAALARMADTLGLSRAPAVARLRERAADLSPELVHPLWTGEALYQIANRLRAIRALPLAAADSLHLAARRLYAAAAARIVDRLAGAGSLGIYHYRAGFGGRSAANARRRGWACLCDHSIAHPAVLQHLVTHCGQLPPAGQSGSMNANWRAILADIAQADAVVVNSEFVRETFLHQGWDGRAVHVVPWGINDEFLSLIPPRTAPEDRLRLLFAGSFGARKGAFALADALARLHGIDWHLDLCGPVDAAASATLRRLCASGRAVHHGVLGRRELAQRMASADVLVLPSLAEGSARVVDEALAAGCYIITTANAGSVVADGRHGRLVQPGHAPELAAAIREAALDRPRIARIGAHNAALVRERYSQARYGERLLDLYQHLSRQ